ncbi:MAG: hypothetical protein QXO82_06880 [Candidatus Methanomethylicia archaeon]
MADNIIENTVPNPLGTQLLLMFGENVKAAFTIRFIIGRNIRKCLLILTNRRIIFYDLELERILSSGIALTAVTGISIEENVLIGKELCNVLKLSVGSDVCLIDILEGHFDVKDVAEALLKLRAREMLRANIVEGDFSWLKSLLDRGGIVLTTVKCPSCGGILDIPNEGKFIKCKYCGQTIFVEDVINIIREVIGLK